MNKPLTIAVTSLICSVIIFALIISNQKVIVQKMINARTPAQNHEPMIGDNWEKWNTTFRYFYSCPEPSGFNVEEYKKNHPHEIVIVKKMADENSVNIYSNVLPDKKIFPYPIEWGKKL